MASVYDCDPSELIEKAAEELKKINNIKAPQWASFAKTGMHKERPPMRNDWWHVRAASILKKIYTLGPIGVSKLRDHYGGKKNRGYKPEHFYKGSGNIIRKVIQQLEKEGFVKTDLKSQHKGRLITAKWKKFLDAVASKISNVHVHPKKEEKEAKKEEKEKEEQKTVKEKAAKEQKTAPDKPAEQKAQTEAKSAEEKQSSKK